MLEVNLHPAGDRSDSKRRRPALASLVHVPGWCELRADPWHWIFVACVVLGPLVLGLPWYAQRSELSGLRAELEQVRADSTRLAGSATLDDSLARRHREISRRIQGLRALDEDRYAWPRLLDGLSRSLPAGVWLTSMEVERPSPDLDVRVEGRGRTPMDITAYVRALEAAPFVESVRIRGSRRVVVGRGQAHWFRVIVSYRTPSPDRRRSRPLLPERG